MRDCDTILLGWQSIVHDMFARRLWRTVSQQFRQPVLPNFPASYPANTECVWDINVMNGYTVKLTVSSNFSLQSSPDCSSDYLEVRLFSMFVAVVFPWKWSKSVLPWIFSNLALLAFQLLSFPIMWLGQFIMFSLKLVLFVVQGDGRTSPNHSDTLSKQQQGYLLWYFVY